MTKAPVKVLFVLAIGFFAPLFLYPRPTFSLAVRPEYAKWGVVAMEATKAEYGIPIVDYLHLGRYPSAPGTAEERFKLRLKDREREFGVIVSVRFYTANDRLISVKFQETDRSAFRRR